MEFIKEEQLLTELREIFEEETYKVKCPVSLNEYELDEIRGYELKQLRNSNISKIVSKLIELVVSKVKSDDGNKSSDDIMEENSYLDYFVLVKGLLDVSYEETEIDRLECPECGAVSEKIKVNYSDYQNTSKEWDKEVPFKDYTFQYVLELKGKNYPKIEMIFKLSIPTIKRFYRFVYSQTKNINPAAIGNSMFPLLSIVDDVIKFFTKKIDVKFYNDKNELVNEMEISSPSSISEIIAPLPIKYKERIENYITEQLKDYVPVFVNKSVKCKECGATIELYMEPQTELINRVLKI